MEGGGEKTRIYVGGLGSCVTEDDLRRTFSPLGEVVAVDVVRTKGRSFAYLDFLPSSDKSLPKLFSTYNGCTWKGGKLRLEKAKEHYLLRLKREWEEEAQQSSKASSDSCNADPSENLATLEKPKKPSSADKPQLNLFFPKLGKVKSLASVGIGKHKYSFQRLQAPSTPTYFCDCEEHSVAFLPTEKKQSGFVNASDGINEQELNIMNSVMNKIFERANPSKQVSEKFESNDASGPLENEEEDHLTDEDNLVINVATGKSDGMDLLGEMRTMMANRESMAKRHEKPKRGQEKKAMLQSKKRKSPHSEGNNGSASVITKESRNSETVSGTKQSGSNSLRSLKSTWKDLIGQKGNTPFSISDIIPTLPQEKEEDSSKKKKIRSKKIKSSSTVHINQESTPEISVPSDFQQKQEQPTLQISESDVHPSPCPQNDEEPRADDLDMPLTTISDILPCASKQNEEQKQEQPTLQISGSDAHPSPRQRNEELKANKVETTSSTPEISVQSDFQQKQEQPTLQNTKSDVQTSPRQQKDEESSADDLDTPLSMSDILPRQNKEELRADDQMPVTNDNLDEPKSAAGGSGAKNEDLIQVARGESWRHKSSWTQLISSTSHSSFSISQVVPDLSFEKHEQQVDNSDAGDSQAANENPNNSATEMNDDACVVGEASVRKEAKSSCERKRRSLLSLGKIESDESCPFMRTEESMKEWKKAKGLLNKKKRPAKESD